MILRLYGPLEPWFDKIWKPGEIELVSAAAGEGLIQKIEGRLDKREQCLQQADARKLGPVERIEFVRECMK
jgi:ABC-type cobalt transport system substrate-binding protein